MATNNFYLEFYKKDHYRKVIDDPKIVDNIKIKGIKREFGDDIIPLLSNNADRQLRHAKFLCADQVGKLVLKPEWHLAIGLGITSLFETSMNLHHLYGVPCIPSSSIKGAVRNYVISNYFEHEGKAIQSEAFCDLFGCPKSVNIKTEEEGGKSSNLKFMSCVEEERKGKLIFFDALPTVAPTIHTDILNPHFPDYYNREKDILPPADWQQPKPVNFLVVKDTPFQFIVGLKKGNSNKLLKLGDEEKTTLSWSQFLLKETLTTQGIGAKTAVGYGFMK